MPTYEKPILAQQLWNAADELGRAVDAVEKLAANSDIDYRTLGAERCDEQMDLIRAALRLCRDHALRLDRTVCQCNEDDREAIAPGDERYYRQQPLAASKIESHRPATSG